MVRQDVAEIRALIARHKRWDVIFGLIGGLYLTITNRRNRA